MAPFTGYHVGDHWAHWLSIGERLAAGGHAPHIFHVNWFRRGDDGRFLWPGFGDNIRVVDWIVKRLGGEVGANPSPIGNLPLRDDLNVDGLSFHGDDLTELLTVDPAVISGDALSAQSVLEVAGKRAPRALWDENAETLRLCAPRLS
jgi:phosphoenolpyruvate carboxykinase (GTP)